MKCSEVLDKFILKQKVMNNSEETIKYYRKRIGYFINFIENKDIMRILSRRLWLKLEEERKSKH